MSQSSTNVNKPTNYTKKNPEIYLPPNKTGKRTLVLDLDETLVHSQFGPFDVPSDVVIKIEIENEIHDIHVLVRPGVKEFLEKLSKRFEIVIFTASISKYAGPLLDILDKNKYCSYRLFREHCTIINTSFVKDLKKLGRDLKDVIIVDNSPIAYLLNNDNGLPILTWFEDKNDRELYKICPVLEFLSLVPDVRDYIPRIVVNNEISYNMAMNVINEYNEMLNKKQMNENIENEKDSNIIENNNELSDSSENNIVLINKDKKQQININIINNNITNYIYDNNNKKLEQKEKNNDYINKENKDEKNKFNPNNIIASVNKPNNNSNPSKEASLSSQVESKPMNKGKISSSMKNIRNNKDKLNKNNLNIKIGQNNTKHNHKKSHSTGINHINKSNKNLGDILNPNTNTNNFVNNKNKNNLSKSSTFRNHTNYNTKNQNNKEMNINNKNNKENLMTKSAKCLNHDKKPLRKSSNNINNQNITVHKKYNFNNNKYEKGQIRLYHNEGNMTTVYKKQRSLIYFNVLNDKTKRNNNAKKSQKNDSNKLIHSVDLTKNEVVNYYHNNNFPLFKKSSNGSNANNGEILNKNKNKNNFLKSGKLTNKKYKNSSSIENMKNKINLYKDFKNKSISKVNKNNIDKQFFFNHTLQEKNIENKEENKMDENDKKDNEQNINNTNLEPHLNLTHSFKLNSKSESMKNLFDSDDDEQNKFSENDKVVIVKKKKNKDNSKCNSAKRPKSSNIFKYSKEDNIKKSRLIGVKSKYNIKRKYSDKNKYVKTLRFDINEILERRGIVKSNRLEGLNDGFKYNLKNNFTANNSKSNSICKNKNKLNRINNINKLNENIMRIKSKNSA